MNYINLATCNITLSITSRSQLSQATIQGEGSGTDLLFITSPHSRLLSLHLVNLLIKDFGTYGQNNVSISLQNISRVVLNDVTLVSNSGGQRAVLLIENCDFASIVNGVVKGNNYDSQSQQGVIQLLNTATVVLKGCIFSSNRGGNGALAVVGGNYLAVSNCIFHDNFAGGKGGAIYQNNMISSTYINCTFNRNTCLGYGGGGAVYALGFPTYATAYVNCTFSKNYAYDGGGAVKVTGMSSTHFGGTFYQNSGPGGGALYSDTSMNVTFCTFTGNSARAVLHPNGDAAYYTPSGGALYLDGSQSCWIANCTFIGNSANTTGGAMTAAAVRDMHVTGCTFVNNSAFRNGGAISLESHSSGVSIIGNVFTSNNALYNGGAVSFSTESTVISILQTIFTLNTAVRGSGGAIYFSASCSTISIGGLLPLTLNITFANATTYENNYFGADHYGYVDMPQVSGYYVVFDATTVLDGDGFYNGIQIIGTGSALLYEGRDYWQYKDLLPFPNTSFIGDLSTWPGIGGNAALYVPGPLLAFNIHEEGDHYHFTVYPMVGRSQDATVFEGNTAAISGGAIFWGDANAKAFIVPGTTFTNNTVIGPAGSGGALYFQLSNNLIHIYSSLFSGNSAGRGGAITVSQSNYPIGFYSCVFSDNYASKAGGGVFLGDGNGFGVLQIITGNAIKFYNTVFFNNTAMETGGAVHVSRVNAVTFNDTSLSGNTAGRDGGALYFDFQNSAQLSSSTFFGNSATRYGGAIASNSGNTISFYNTTYLTSNNAGLEGGVLYACTGSVVTFHSSVKFVNNSCLAALGRGGAVSVSVNSALTLLGESSFFGNTAGQYGGAVYSSASALLLGSEDIVFDSNTASQGSALRLEALAVDSLKISPSNTTAISFSRNRCRGRGGTVSWTKDPTAQVGTYSAGSILNFKRIVYRSNIAVFGSTSSTQATSLRYAGKNVTLVSTYYSKLLPHPSVHLLDFFSAKDITDSTAVVTAVVVTSSCSGRVGYLSGVTTSTALTGEAVFTSLTAFCYPGGNMTLKYTG
jgi:predicted outer membrane repeat protein